MDNLQPYLKQILMGDCISILNSMPEKSVDMVFADPPYNLQLKQELWRPNFTKVEGVVDEWDKFEDWQEYDRFSEQWLSACKRVLKDTGTIWVIGTYHNIYRIGSLMQELGFWFLNDIVWIKNNPMPNFRGARFTNAHETLIWACKKKGARYTFNYQAMKSTNDDLQMRSDWFLPICTGSERIRVNGKKGHSTQKPLALLYRILQASTNPGDVVLDPFFGTGTTGVIAESLHRQWIGIEKESDYISIASQRLADLQVPSYEERIYHAKAGGASKPRIPFASLIEQGLISPGQKLYFKADRDQFAQVKADGHLLFGQLEGSIHTVGRQLMNNSPCNGWEVWFYEDHANTLHPINDLRLLVRRRLDEPQSCG